MKKVAHWMLLTTDRGGMLRVNVHDVVTDGGVERITASADRDFPLSDLSEEEEGTVLDAFAIVAGYVGATMRQIHPVDAHERPASLPTVTVKKSVKKSARRGR